MFFCSSMLNDQGKKANAKVLPHHIPKSHIPNTHTHTSYISKSLFNLYIYINLMCYLGGNVVGCGFPSLA